MSYSSAKEGVRARRASGNKSRRKPTQKERLLEIINETVLWHSLDGTPYATVRECGHFENCHVRSQGFRNWLAGRYFDLHNSAPSAQATEEALRIFQLKAARGPSYSAFVRVGEAGGRIYFDLGGPDWRAVEIDKTGWRLVEAARVKFVRSRSMRELPEPERGQTLDVLRPLLNTRSEEDFRLVVACLLSWLRPTGPFPILVIRGEQGSAKSSMMRLLRDIVDPATAGIRSMPREERDLHVAARNTWLLTYDNISGIAGWLSDVLCRLSTGGGFGTRQLHTDFEEILFDAQRPVVINGIPDTVSRPDLADRAVVISLSAIPDDQRITEAEVRSRFEGVLPYVLGALLDAVSCALRRKDSVILERLPRMADFVVWVSEAEPALGWKDGSFLKAYLANRHAVDQVTIDDDPVASAIHELASVEDCWEGSATELLAELTSSVSDAIHNSRAWPKSPASLSRRIDRLKPVLRRAGINIERGKAPTPDRKRLIVITNATNTNR